MKITKRILLFFILVTTLVFGTTPDTTLKNSEDLQSGKLKNGINYYFIKNNYPLNKASVNLVINSGSLKEKNSEMGGAHFLEHMAFNGTKEYPKNDLVKYLESIGLKFGDDLNAYTSFDETVYMLDIPSTEKDLKTSLKILEQWAFNISIKEEDVKNEKNIILEEWRMEQGVKDRVFNTKKEFLFKDSQYKDRLPIGTFDSISSLNARILRGYYEREYTPQMMSVIVVGNFNFETVKKEIENIFEAEKPKNSATRKPFSIPPTESNTVVFRDKDLTDVTLSMSHVEKFIPLNTAQTIKNSLIEELYYSIFNNRVDILKKKSDSPFMSAAMYSYALSSNNKIVETYATFKEDKINEGYHELLKLVKNMSTYAPYKSELEDEKIDILSRLELNLANKDSIENSNFVEAIKDHALLGDLYLSPKTEYNVVARLLKDIRAEDILKYGKRIASKNKLTFLTIPEKESLKKIDDKMLVNTENSVKTQESQPWEKVKVKELEKIVKNPGEFGKVDIENLNQPFEIFNSELSNGIKVLYKKTNFEKDKIYINIYKKEGNSVENKELYFNSLIAPYMLKNSGVGNLSSNEFKKFMKGKNFNVTPYIDDYTHGFYIESDNKSLPDAMNTLLNYAEKKNFDDEIFNSFLNIQKEKIATRENSPVFLHEKTLQKLLYQDNFRRVPMTLDELALINKKDILTLYDKKFSDFSDYTVIVTGSLSEIAIQNYMKKYIATLPTKNHKKESIKTEDSYKSIEITNISTKTSNNFYKPLNIKFEPNIKEVVVKKGEDDKARVTIVYPYKGVVSNDNRNLFNAFSEILNIILIENIREKNAQVYNISSSANLEYANLGENCLEVSFTTNYSNVNTVITNVKTTIFDTVNGNYDKNKINDIITHYNVNYETGINNNSFWNRYIFKRDFATKKNYSVLNPEKYSQLITYENINQFVKDAISPKNYVQVTLLPEKTSK